MTTTGLGNLPASWRSERAKWLVTRQIRAPRVGDGIVTAFRDGQVTLRAKRRTEGFTEASLEIGYQGIRKSDLVVHSMDAFAGAIGISDSDGKASPVVHAYTPNGDVDGRFAAYALRSMAFSGYIETLAKGIRERSTSFDASTFANLIIPCPALDEQRRIADFLDAETAQIDRVAEIRSEQSTLIDQRFTRLVDGVVIGDVDALKEVGYSVRQSSWSVGKIARLFSVIPGYAFPSSDFIEAGAGVRLLRGINVSPGWVDWESETMAWDLKSSPIERRFHLRLNDLVIGMDRPWISGGVRAALIRESDLPSLLLQRVACIRPHSTSTTHYLRWVLRSSHFQSALEGETTGISVPHISGDQIASFTYRVPPPDDQILLASLLQRQDDLRATQAELVSRQLALLAERRQALITAAVTGQIDVTTAREVST